MTLYRYLSSHVVETLLSGQFKTAKVSEFNDPLEFLYKSKGIPTLEDAKQYIRSRQNNPLFYERARQFMPAIKNEKELTAMIEQKIDIMAQSLVDSHTNLMEKSIEERIEIADRSIRVLCFSAGSVTPENEILMWSHYANGHRGFRIGIDFQNLAGPTWKISPIEYKEDRLEINPLHSQLNNDVLRRSITTKSRAWEYEYEYRLLTVPRACITRNGMDFWECAKEWVSELTFGMACDFDTESDIAQKIQDTCPHVKLRKAHLHSELYAIEYKDY